MKFEPVFLPTARELDNHASQTFLRHFNGCPRSGYLYQLHKGEASTVQMVRGSAVHTALERATNAAVDQGERKCPPEVAKAILEEVLREKHVPLEEHDYMRELMARWAEEWEVDPENIVSVERLFVLDILGWEVRAKIDYAELRDNGRRLYVADYKSGRGAPTAEDVSRVRPDGTLMAKSFQLVLYALALAFGVPVRVDVCPLCNGSGVFRDVPGLGEPCEVCKGKPRRETREPVGVGRTVVDFDMEFVFPGIEGKDGLMLRRPMSLTRLELEEYRGSLAAILSRLRMAETTGDWPAMVSDSACGECPSKRSCPIPRELNSHAGTVNSMEDAAEALEVLTREKAEHAARRKELKQFSVAHGPIRFGNGMVAMHVPKSKTSIPKRDDMLVAMQRALDFGEPFNRDDWVRTSTHTEFVDKEWSDEEIAAVAAGAEKEQG